MNQYKYIFLSLIIFFQIYLTQSQEVKIDKINQPKREKENEELNITKLDKDLFEKQIEVFTLGEFTTFELFPNSGEYIYYFISNPCVITFAFFLSDIEKYISLYFMGPENENNISLSFTNKNYLFYEYKIEKEGKYIFYLDNEKNEEKVEISFAIKDSAKKDENIGSKKLDKITEYIEDMESKINKIRLKQNIINKKTDAHNEGVNKHNKNILINSFYEVLIMIFILVAQLYYIKKNISKI